MYVNYHSEVDPEFPYRVALFMHAHVSCAVYLAGGQGIVGPAILISFCYCSYLNIAQLSSCVHA